MQPNGGVNIGKGVISVSAVVDEAQIAKSVGDAGKKAGQGFNKSLADHFKRDKSAVISAGAAGEDSAKASGTGFGSKLKAMGPMLATAGLAVGAAVGAAIAGSVMSAIDKENVQAQMKAKFGLSPEESKANGAISGKLYAQGFGDSAAEVGDAAGLIGKLTGASGKALEDMTKQGLTLQKVFGYDVKESIAAANNIVANGLAPNTTAAFDLIAKGAQMGLDVNDDLIDSLTEYSTQWNKLGVTGPAALGLMSQAQKAGIRNTDLLNDAFKEFSIRAIDGSKGTTAAFKELGLSTTEIPAALAKGGPEATAALDQVIKKIQGIKDPVKQSQTAVALFGTQFEDMGPKVFNSLDVVAAGATKVGNTTGQMITDLSATTAARFETIKRTAQQWATNIAGNFLNMAAEGVKQFKALWNGEGGAGPFSNLGPIIQKVKALGGTFKEIFDQIKTVVMENKSQFQTFFNFILGISNILWSAVGPIFKALGAAIKAVIGILGGLIDFFAGVFTGDWKRAGDGLHKIWFSLWEGIKGILMNVGQALLNIVKGIWSGIKGTVMGFVNWFVNGWKTAWTNAKNDVINMGNAIKDGITSRFNTMKTNINNAINGVKGFITGMRDHIGNMVRSMGDKFTAFKDNTIRAFTLAKDGVAKVWNKLQDVAKKPVNFVIDPVYANIRNLWNNIASKVGLAQLPAVAKFAKGGIAPGSGNRDTVPAMLTPGEGILTKKEMKKIGGPKGFAQLRKEIQYFSGGGVVGWIKDKVGGAARGALYSGAKSVADKFIYPYINSMQGGNGFDGLLKAGANKLVGGALNWIKADDKKNAAPAGSAGMGYKKQMQILQSKFPGLGLISGYRPGSRTLSGNVSYHASGRAVDVAPRKDVASFIYDNYKKITKELITPYQQYNLHNGQNHRYTGAIWNQHNFAGGNAHDHWAVDNGGVLKPGTTATLTNATSDNEYMLTKAHLKDVVGDRIYNVNMTVNFDDIDDVSKMKRVLEDLDKELYSGVQGY
jgi:phage-related minor tail protein